MPPGGTLGELGIGLQLIVATPHFLFTPARTMAIVRIGLVCHEFVPPVAQRIGQWPALADVPRQCCEPLRCLTHIGFEACGHRRDAVGIGWISSITVRAGCTRTAAFACPFTEEGPFDVIFADPAMIIAPRTVPHHRIPN